MKLLTIAIPTFNRACYLDLCLSQICKQLHGNEEFVDLIVSNNASTDNTEEIVQKYLGQGYDINYVRNAANIGMDGNITQAYKLANSKYVLIFGDDDALLDGSLNKILHILRSGEFGIVYMPSYSYLNTFSCEMSKNKALMFDIYEDRKKFVKKVSYYFTFISGNIINKTLVDNNIDFDEFNSTFLAVLIWTFSALFNSKQNVYVDQYLTASKAENTGGYQLCKVFGENINKVFSFFIERGIDKNYFEIINRKLLFSFFPYAILNLRKGKGSFMEEGNYFRILYPVFYRYLNFWLFTFPAIFFPVSIVNLASSFARGTLKILRTTSRLLRRFQRRLKHLVKQNHGPAQRG